LTATLNDQVRPAPRTLPRVLPETAVRTLRAHLDRYGPLPARAVDLIDRVEQSGLTGHGGAGFPAGVKMRAVASATRAAVVVANGTEGEPASAKDKTLLDVNPHLVLDGVALAARAVGATEAVICVDRAAPGPAKSVLAAIAERERYRVDEVAVTLERAPSRYVSGEETALVAWLDGGDARPRSVPPRPFERGVRGRPTLVQNVETLAHLALIARFGPDWFRALGTDDSPGTALVTLSGAFGHRGVFEIAFGLPVGELFAVTSTDAESVQALLIGGYFGTWVAPHEVASLTLDGASLRAHGSSFGCGVLVALARDRCGLAESARVARWLAGENAGQCGPCVNGLPAIAGAMARLVQGDRTGEAEQQLRRWLTMVKGRGACKHPDGAARFVESSLRVFASEIERHRRSGPCRATALAPALPLPRPGAWR
jgi:NADH:ubiquinone oxidoreductase subunit F (NADH-binding)